MARTESQIVDDVISLLKGTPLAGMLTGEICRESERAKDSRLEDTIVYLASATASQVQSGTVVINIFVDDFDARGDGVAVKNGQRCKEIEEAAQQWFDTLTAEKSNYLWELAQAISADNEPSIRQHFVVIRMRFKYLD